MPVARERNTSQGAFLALGALLLIAAGVFFVLPDLLTPSESTPTTTVPGSSAPVAAPGVAQTPTATPTSTTPSSAAAQSPWQQAQADRERAAAKTALDALLALQYELQERKAEDWAKAEFDAATALAQQGDAAYRDSRFGDAAARYREGEAALRSLRDGIPARLEERLAAGEAAFAAGDQATAIASFSDAAAIEPANARAVTGLERSRRLDQLGAHLSAGKSRESAGQFEQAAASYREALSLDSNWEPARQALAAVEARITGERSAARMSAGYAALAAGRLEDARREFQAAIPLGGGTAAREGLQRPSSRSVSNASVSGWALLTRPNATKTGSVLCHSTSRHSPSIRRSAAPARAATGHGHGSRWMRPSRESLLSRASSPTTPPARLPRN